MPDQKTVRLAQMGEYGENIYDFAKSGRWGKANTNLRKLEYTFGKYNSSSGKTDQPFATRLGQQIASLSQSVADRNMSSTMQTSNSITYQTAKFTADLNASIPKAVTLLDYYGRELEIGSLFGNSSQIQASVSKIRGTWNAVRSKVISEGGDTQAKAFDALVGSLEKPNSVQQYSKLAITVLNKVDSLENVFKAAPDGEKAD